MTAGQSRRFVEADDVAPLAREVFGANRRLSGMERLRGGSKKGVYRLHADDGRSVVLYVWSAEENFWPDAPSRRETVSDLDLFQASRSRLEAAGVRVPRLYLAARAGEWYPVDVAVIEDLRGGTLEARLQRDPEGAAPMLDRLAEMLRLMSRCRAPLTGRIADVEAGAERGSSCPDTVLRWSLKDLDEAARRVESIANEREAFEQALRTMHATLEPRPDHGIIHNELGPDHVMLDDQGEPVLIDIEGASYFDVEWEHVFLKIRFGEHYERLRLDGLDGRRMRFYQLAQHLSLVAGPLRLLDGDFPDREFMLSIATGHTEGALAFLRGDQ